MIRIAPSETYRGGEGGGRVQWSRGSVDSEKRLECVRVCVCVWSSSFEHAGGTEKGEEIGCPVLLESWHWSANLCVQWIVFKPFFVFVLFVVQCVGICDFLSIFHHLVFVPGAAAVAAVGWLLSL